MKLTTVCRLINCQCTGIFIYLSAYFNWICCDLPYQILTFLTMVGYEPKEEFRGWKFQFCKITGNCCMSTLGTQYPVLSVAKQFLMSRLTILQPNSLLLSGNHILTTLDICYWITDYVAIVTLCCKLKGYKIFGKKVVIFITILFLYSISTSGRYMSGLILIIHVYFT